MRQIGAVSFFDILAAPDGSVTLDRPLQERRHVLEALMADEEIPKGSSSLRLRPIWPLPKTWLRYAGHSAMDGVIAKELTRAYELANGR